MAITLVLIWSVCCAGGVALWGVSVARRDVGVVDVFWGPAFVVAEAVAWARGGWGRGWRLAHVGLVAVWGVRLAVHIAWRGRGRGEDRRYAAMRRARGPSFWWVSLFKVFLLQATLAAALSAPLAIVQMRGAIEPGWCIAGLALWVAGFACEAAADAQLLAFQGDPASRGRVLDSGLWRFSRHPNYFGEALLWWGYGAFAAGAAGGFWTLYSPLVVTVLLLRISGVPLLEAGMAARRPGYASYVERTSAFVPWPPRGAGGAA